MDLLYYTILSAVIIILIPSYFKNYFKLLVCSFGIRGPSFVENIFFITNNKKLEKIGNNVSELYGSLMKIWIGIVPVICIYEPKHLKLVLGNSRSSQKNIFYTVLHNFIGEGLITNNGIKWKTNRKLIQPYFNLRNIEENFLKIFCNCANKHFVVNLSQLNNGEEIKITNLVNQCVIEILYQSILGTDFNKKLSPFRNKASASFLYRLTRPWLLFELVFKCTSLAETEIKQRITLRNYTQNFLEKRQSQKKKETNCLLDMFIEISEHNSAFTFNDIINETCTFMLAGQDSVGSAIAFTLYFLAKHQEMQEKVLLELNQINCKNEAITIDDLNQMKYLEQCIKETLRLLPSIPIISRVLTQQVKLDKFVLPAGTNICILPFCTHRLARIYLNPLQFNPDRHFGSYDFLPFSTGARNCIGYKFAYLEMKTIISTIVRNYRLNLSPKSKELNLSYRVTLRAKGGIYLRLLKR